MTLKKNVKGEKEEEIKNINTHKKKWMDIFKEFEPKKENMISILHCIQDNEKFHYIPLEAIEALAAYLRVTPSEIVGVISFYTLFSREPRGQYIIRVCTSAPCYCMGDTVIEACEKILGIHCGETTADHVFTLESSSCLGLCDGAPALMINDTVYTNVTSEKIKEILEGKYE